MKYRRYAEYKDSGVEWLGEVPAHWEDMQLKRELAFVTSGSRGWAENYADEGDIFLRIGNLTRDSVALDLSDIQYVNAPAGPEAERTRVQPGDLLVSITADLGSVAVVPELFPTAYINQHIALARPVNARAISRWLAYQILSIVGKTQLALNAYGGTKIQLSLEDIGTLRILVPSLDEQHCIVDFLDRETAQIDALIAKQERLIAVLQEKRQALISHAVTKGLNPAAPMKDSGVEWLGEVPAHWGVRRNKSIYQEIDDRSTTGEEELLSVSHITGVTARSEKTVNMFMAETLENYKRCQPGDLVINTMWAYMGALGTAKIPGVVSPSYNVYRGRKLGETNPQYIDYLYRIPRHVIEIGRNSRGVWESRLRLYPDEFLDMRTPLPPRPEQDQIVEYIRQKNEQYTLAEKRCQDCIELLQERRAVLISAAVTGKIDVRNLVN